MPPPHCHRRIAAAASLQNDQNQARTTSRGPPASGRLPVPGTGVTPANHARRVRTAPSANRGIRRLRANGGGELPVPGTGVSAADCRCLAPGFRIRERVWRHNPGHATRAQVAASGAGARTACGDAARASARAHRERRPDACLRGVREARLRRRRGDRHAARARLRRGRRRPPRGRGSADPARLRGARAGSRAARATRDPSRMRPPGLPARCGGGRATSALRRAGGRGRRLLDRRVAARRAHRGDPRGARRPALGAAAALRARLGDEHGPAGPDGAALRVQRPEHDRRLHPHRSRPRPAAGAGVCRSSAQQACAARRVHHPRRRAPPRPQLPRRSKKRASARSSR